ncbi:MAG: N-acyl homoserine lactonase family protein [Clostridiales bacterium]|nr:N-acyl homoserine lactonase family protein [Clostridiales bacterium]
MKKQKMYLISCGMIMCDLCNLVCMPVMGNANQHETTSVWAKSPVTCMLIENENGLVLFDTGCHPKAMTERWDENNRLRTPVTIREDEGVLSAIRMLGKKPSDVKYIVLSHLHEDHAGCLEFFPNAEVFVSDRELTQTMRLFALGGDMGGYIYNDIQQWLRQKVKWRLVDDDLEEMELFPGLKILNFGPGHTFGMMGLLIELEESGNYILASDCINTGTNYGPPVRFPGLAYDTIGYRKTVERIRRLEKQYQAKVLFGHDIDQYETLKFVPEYYD